MANHIVPMILERIHDEMVFCLITDVAENDPTRVDAVKIGRFQENPSNANIRIAIMGGDLDDPEYLDGIAPRVTRNNPIGWTIEPREIGGTQMWYRRGTVRLELYWIIDRYDEDTSRNYAYAILGRIQNYIERVKVSDLRDDFGEHAIKLFSPANSIFQSGGPPQSYIWRGKVLWECLTEREWN